MLKITIPKSEFWNEKTQEFISINETVLVLEHSLVSLSKWESKWKKPFLSETPKTHEERLDYVRCMSMTQNVNPIIYNSLSSKQLSDIDNYINDTMTATTFSDIKTKGRKEIITAEIIYYWMVSFNIPFECQKWHLQRLLTLIRVCSSKNAPQKKMSTKEIMSRNRSLNRARRAQLKSNG